MLNVNEIFGPTVQGEGKSAGMPCAFMRLAFCNLHCIWCDTPHTWNWKGTKWLHLDKFDLKQEVHQMTDEQIIEKLEQIGEKTLIISGGEPLLQHKQLISLCEKLKGFWIEIETNGTIFPDEKLISLVNQINCSPKLANSGDLEKLRRKPALKKLAQCPKVNFKFVITSDEDIVEVIELTSTYQMKEVRLMPEARTKDELISRSLSVKKLCEKYNFIFCTRLSIMMAGTTRGV